MLKFIGSGSAFNTKLGNNSAYYKEGNQMLLIDCGSNIFQRIKENNLLEGIEHIHVLITHTHADHVGSLADLILYTYYSHGEFAKSKVTVYSPSDTKVDNVLELNGCVEHTHFQYIPTIENEIVHIDGFKNLLVTFFESKHVDEISSYSLDIVIDETIDILYTSDASEIPLVHILHLATSYDYAFIDTCKADYEGNVHLSLRKLTELIKPELRHKVYCMHLDEGFDRNEADALGFNVVVNEF